MNRTAFYAALRSSTSAAFGKSLSQKQVQGCEAILDEAERRASPLKHAAYVLATAYHESAATMQPVRETLASTDDRAILILEKSWKAGKLPWVKTPYWRKDADGKSWLGRGLVQLTHKANYVKMARATGLDLVGRPELAMDLKTAVDILFYGMIHGSFTGKKLSDYITEEKADYFGARRIVNGTDRAADIAVLAKAFEAALKAAGYAPGTSQAPDAPKPAHATPGPATLESGPVPSGNWLGAILKAIAAIFGAKS